MPRNYEATAAIGEAINQRTGKFAKYELGITTYGSQHPFSLFSLSLSLSFRLGTT